jgi:4-amino-4-deoxy-L-arabinose transferase-like glycosyltransferase
VHRFILAVLFLLMVGRIIPTWFVFNDTADEQAHIIAGLEVFDSGSYDFEAQHPPLARAVIAALPYFRGGLRRESYWLWDQGAWLHRPIAFYWYTLALARAGTLVFVGVAFIFVWLWSSRLFGQRAGLVACLLLACCPNVLGHGGLATLDVAAAATVLAASYCLWRWSESGEWRWCLASALAVTLAVLSKFSALGFLPPIALAFFLLSRTRFTRTFAAQLGAFALTAPVLLWAGYGFKVGSLAPPGHRYESMFPMGAQLSPPRRFANLVAHHKLPAPAFWKGLIDLSSHNHSGHDSYLLGQVSRGGWWYYFPVVLAVKTTLPLLVLVPLALWLGDRRKLLYPLLGALIVLAVSMTANINIGVRHILAMYLFFVIAASGLVAANLSRRVGWLVAALVVWHVAESVIAHPDYLAYFNEIARGREERFLADSNLDWGQDLARLGRYVQEHNIQMIQLRRTGSVDPGKFNIHHKPVTGEPGWVAVSGNHLLGIDSKSEVIQRLRLTPPYARIGKSIWLYRIP